MNPVSVSTVGVLRVGVYVMAALMIYTSVQLARWKITGAEHATNLRLLFGAQVVFTGTIAYLQPQIVDVMSVLLQVIIFMIWWVVSGRIGDVPAAPVPIDLARLTETYPIIIASCHRDDTWWHEAPLPGRRHRCSAQTTAVQNATLIERCACGAIRLDGHGWMEKNARRKDAET